MAIKSVLKAAIMAAVLTSAAIAGTPGWETNWEAAKATAKAENKFILINLTGTDWCGWCIKLEKEVFSQKAFKDFAAANVVMMEADFPKKKELSPELKVQNAALKKQYLLGGYPTVLLLNADGEKISEDLGELKGGTEAYIKKISELIAKNKK